MSLYSSDPIINVYLNEVLDSSAAQGQRDIPDKKKDTISALGNHSQQRVKKAVYEINKLAKEKGISINAAYFQYMKTATLGGLERNAIKQKLGFGGAAVKEERITEVKGFGGKVDPNTGKFDTSVTSSSQKKYREGLTTRSRSHGRGSSQGLTNVPANKAYNGGVGDPDLAMTPARRAELAAKRAERQGEGKRANKIRSTMTRTEHREYILNRAVNKESFGWKSELNEYIGVNKKEGKDKKEKIVEKPVNNKIKICPSISENSGFEISDATLDLLAEYFYNEGLNEYGVDILIENLGVDGFCDFADEIINEELLFEWRRGPDGSRVRGNQTSKSGKHISTLKGGAKSASVRATPEHKARKAAKESGPSSTSGMKDSLKRQSEIAKAKKEQKPTKSTPEQTKKETKRGIFGALKDRAARDTELLKKSWKTAREVGKKHEKTVAGAAGTVAGVAVGAAKVAHRAGQEFAKSKTGQQVKRTAVKGVNAAAGAAGAGLGARKAGKSIPAAAGRAAGTFVKKLRQEEAEVLDELVKSKAKKKSSDLVGPGEAMLRLYRKGMIRHNNALANRELEAREKGINRAGLAQSYEIEGDLVEQGDSASDNAAEQQRQSRLHMLMRQHQVETARDERNKMQAEKRFRKKIAELGGNIDAIDEIYHFTPQAKKETPSKNSTKSSDEKRYGKDPEQMAAEIRARNRARLNNSYVSDLEMTEEAPDINQKAVDAVINNNGGPNVFAKKREPGEKLPPLKHPKNKGGVNPTYYQSLSREFGESSKSIDSLHNTIPKKDYEKHDPGDTKVGKVIVTLPNAGTKEKPKRIVQPPNVRFKTSPPRNDVYTISDKGKVVRANSNSPKANWHKK
jgi:hypothetical protein